MAASMAKCRICSSKTNIFYSRRCYETYKAYYTAIPVMPKDTPENNVLLKTADLPRFSKITKSKMLTGCAKTTMTYDVELTKHIDSLEEQMKNGKKPTFDEVYRRHEELTVPMEYMRNVVSAMSLMGGNNGANATSMLKTVYENVSSAREVFLVKDYYQLLLKKLDQSELTEEQKRVYDRFALEARSNGYDLKNEKDIGIHDSSMKMIMDEQTEFYRNVDIFYRHYKPKLEDFLAVEMLPTWLQKHVSINKMDPSRGPFVVPLENEIYYPFMAYCPSRKEREKIWKTKMEICSLSYFSDHISNHQRIDKIIELRNKIANVHGYNTYADWMLSENRMADSVENVMEFIKTLKAAYKDKMGEEMAQLQEFASSVGFKEKLKWWDLTFYERLQFEHMHKVNSSDLIEYFPYDKVHQKILTLFSKLLGISFSEVTSGVEVWDENVKLYHVLDTDSGEEVGSFYLDPFGRADRTKQYIVSEIRDRSQILDLKPLAMLFYNVHPPVYKSAFVTVDDIGHMMATMTRTLQIIMSREQYSHISGIKYVDLDTSDSLPGCFSKMATNKHMLKWFSSHFQTDEKLSDDVIDNLLKARKHNFATYKMKDLYQSALDLELHLSVEEWSEEIAKIFNDFMPLPYEKKDSHLCSDLQLFGVDARPCLNYGRQWSEMISAELYNAFEEVGFENLDNLIPLGRRLKETYFSLGSRYPQKEVFRRFIGRDPSLSVYLEQNKPYLITSNSESTQ